MKKLLLFFVGLFVLGVVVLGLGLAVILNSGFQRWALLKVLPEGSELREVSAGFSAVDLRGLRMPLEEGGRVSVPDLKVRYQLRPLVFGNTVHVDSVEAFGIDVRLPAAAEREVVGTEVPVEERELESLLGDIFQELRAVEVPFILGRLHLDGEVSEPSGGRFAFEVSGGDFAPGAEGSLNWTVRQVTAPGVLGEALPQLEATGTLLLGQTGSGGVGKIVKSFAAQGSDEGGLQLLELGGNLELGLAGSGAGESPLISQNFDLRLAQPGRLLEALEGFEVLAVSSALRLEEQGGGFLLSAADLVAFLDDRPVVEARLFQPMRLDSLQSLEGELFVISVSELAPNWLDPLMPDGLRLEGAPLSFSAAVAGLADGSFQLTLAETALGPVSALRGEETLLRDIRVTTAVDGRVHPDGPYSFSIPGFDLRGGDVALASGRLLIEGDFTQESAEIFGRFSAQLQALAREPVLAGRLGELPAAAERLQLSLQASLQGDQFNLANAELSVGNSDQEIVRMALLQALKVNLASGQFEAAEATATLADLQIVEARLSLFKAFFPEGLEVVDRGINGHLALRVKDGRFALSTIEPLSVRQLGLVLDGDPVLRDLDLALNFGAELGEDALTLALKGLTMAEGVRKLGEIEGSVRVPMLAYAPVLEEVEGQLAWNLSLSGIVRQPVLAGQTAPLLTGEANGQASFEGLGKRAELELQVRRLMATTSGGNAQKMDLKGSLRERPDGRGEIEFETVFGANAGGPASDLAGVFRLKPGAEVMDLSGQLSSRMLRLEDVQALAALAETPEAASVSQDRRMPPRPSSPTAPAAPSRPALDAPAALPPWSGLRATLGLRVDRLVLNPNSHLDTVRGEIRISEPAAELVSFSAGLGEGALKGSGAARFDERTGDYNVAASFDGERINPAVFAGNGARFSGLFHGQVEVNGEGKSLPEAIDQAEATIEVKGTDGILSVLNLESPRNSTAMGVVGLLGAATNNEGLNALAGALPYFNRITFDNFDLRLQRSKTGEVELSALEVVGPHLSIQGDGRVAPGPWGEMLRQPMFLSLNVGARGPLANHLGTLGLVRQEVAADGFRMSNQELRLGGSLSNPDASSIQDMLWRAATSALTGGRRSGSGQSSNGEASAREQERPSEIETGVRILEGLLRR